MKIGILTLPFNNNYGGLLQCYALQNFLKEEGHEVYVIKHHTSRPKTFTSKISDAIRIITGKTRKYKKQIASMQQFEKQYFQETHPICSTEEYKNLKKYNFDALIVGSDQVWRFQYTEENFSEYFFNFAKEWDIKRYAFAASFGVDTWDLNASDTKKLQELCKIFDKISVRELTGVKLCKENLHCDSTHLLDPTFLLSPDEYRLLYDNKILKDNTLAVYLLDINPSKMDAVKKISQQMHLNPIYIGRNPQNNIFNRVEDWLKGIDSSNLVITDSFHGVVFSIIFNKPFVLIMNEARGANRFFSLFQTFGFNKTYSCATQFSPEYINRIDTDLRNQIIEENKKSSISFIKL